jgi:hypothetical protein
MPAMIGFDYGDLWKWEDFDPSRLSRLMSSFDAPWWVAGAGHWTSGWDTQRVATWMSTLRS